MALTGSEPISAANLKAVVEKIVGHQQELAVTRATVKVTYQSAGSGSYYTRMSVLSASGITATIAYDVVNQYVTLKFPTPGTYEVTVDPGIYVYINRDQNRLAMGSTFTWTSPSQGNLVLGMPSGGVVASPDVPGGNITVKRIA